MASTSVRVALRVRPLSEKETVQNCSVCVTFIPDAPQILIGTDRSFTFDHVYSSDITQEDMFQDCSGPMVDKFIEGYNSTILAYGQTGSGKTYSMGTALDSSNIPDEQLGIVPRAISKLFSDLEARKAKNPDFEYELAVSFLELYNEDLIDLLNPAVHDSHDPQKKGKQELMIREDANGQIYWSGVKEVPVKSPDELLSQLQKGSLCRTVACTDMNKVSSRSHAIFSVILKQTKIDEPDMDKENDPKAAAAAGDKPTKIKNKNKPLTAKITSKFHFVDLAGSERLKRTNASGDRAKEGIAINGGLLALGNVISALGDDSRKVTHVPYRDSKLTRLLQDSLGGNSQTLMLACISPADSNFMETLNTLKYANRARNIKNKVSVNETYGNSSVEVNQLRSKISRLQMEIQALHAGGVGEETKRQYEEHIKELQGQLGQEKMKVVKLETDLVKTSAERDTILVERDNVPLEVNPIIQKYAQQITELKSQVIELQCQPSAGLVNHRKSSLAGSSSSKEKGHISFSIETDLPAIEQAISDGKKRKRSKKNRRAQPHDGEESQGQPEQQSSRQAAHEIVLPESLEAAKNLFAHFADPVEQNEEDDDVQDDETQGPEGAEDEAWAEDSTLKKNRRLRRNSARNTLEKAKEQIKQGLLFLKNGGSMHDDPILSQLIKTPSSTKSESYIDQMMQNNTKNEKRRSSSVSFSDIQTIEVPAWEEPKADQAQLPRRVSNSSRSVSFSDNQPISPSSTKSSQNSTGYSTQQQNALTLTRMLHQIQADIAVKEQLVNQLERAEQEFHNMRSTYEQKLSLMQESLINLQRERDAAMKRAGTGVSTRDKNSILTELKARYEHKMKKLIAEIGILRRKYNEATQVNKSSKSQTESNIKHMKVQIEQLKSEKLRMIKRLKTETERIREVTERNEREIQDLRRKTKSAQQEKKRLERAHEVQKLVLEKRNKEVLQTNSKLKSVMTLLKRTSTPKSIAKAFRGKRSKVAPDAEKDKPPSRRASDEIEAIQAEIFASGNEKKKYLDKAIDQYITGSQAFKLIDELSKKHAKLDAEKKEYLAERERIIAESFEATGNLDSTHEALAQDLDDKIETINSEITYISARVRVLRNETTNNENNTEGEQSTEPGCVPVVSESRRSSQESDTNKNRRKSSDGDKAENKDLKNRRKSSDSKKRLSLPPNAPPQMAYDTAVHILRNLDAFEQQAVLECFLKDIVDLRTGEWSRQMTLAYQEKTIRELNKNLLAMRRAAVSKTLLYETKIKQLEEELRYGGRTPSPITPTGLELEVANIEHDASNTISLFDKIYENSIHQVEAAVVATGGLATPRSIEEYERATSSKRNSIALSGSGSGSKRNSISGDLDVVKRNSIPLSGSGSSSKRNSLADLDSPGLSGKRNSIPLNGSGSSSKRNSLADLDAPDLGGKRNSIPLNSSDSGSKRNSYFAIADDEYASSPNAYSPNSPTVINPHIRASFSQPPLPPDWLQLQPREKDSQSIQPPSPPGSSQQLQRRTSRESIQHRDSRESLQREAVRRAATSEHKSRTWSDGEYSNTRTRHQKQNSDPTSDHIKWADGGDEGHYQQKSTPPSSPPIERSKSLRIDTKELPPSKNNLTHQRRGSLRDSSSSMGFYSAGSPDHEASNRDSGYFSDKRRSQSSMARRGSKDLSHLKNNSWNRAGSPDSDDASVTSERACRSRSQTPTGENVFDRLSKGSTMSSNARNRSKSHTQERRGSIHRETLAVLEGRRQQGTS